MSIFFKEQLFYNNLTSFCLFLIVVSLLAVAAAAAVVGDCSAVASDDGDVDWKAFSRIASDKPKMFLRTLLLAGE